MLITSYQSSSGRMSEDFAENGYGQGGKRQLFSFLV